MPSPTSTDTMIREQLAGVPQGALSLRKRIELFESFQQVPLLNASVLITDTAPTLAQMALRLRANRNFETIGTGTIADADHSFAIDGGVTISSDTATPAANENTNITPHLDTLQTLWAKAGLWGTEDLVNFHTCVRGASIANVIFRAGIYEDTTQPADLASTGSDDNAAFFIFDEDQATSATQWLCVTNVSGVDTVTASGVAVAASTDYVLEIKIDTNRQPHFFINGKQVSVGPVMTDAIDLIPFIGVATDTNAAKTMTVRYLRMSREI